MAEGWKHLPCPFCDVLAFENGSTYGGLVVRGMIRDHKMVQHFGVCPEVNPILSNVVAPRTSERIRFDRILKVVVGLVLVCTHVICLLVGMVLVQGDRIVDLKHLTHLEGLVGFLVSTSNQNAEEIRGELTAHAETTQREVDDLRDLYTDSLESIYKQFKRVPDVKGR